MSEGKKPDCKKKPEPGHTPFLNFFAVYVITMTFIYIFSITFYPIPKLNIRFADTSLGFLLGTVFAWIINWAFRTAKAQIDKQAVEHQIKLNGDKNETP
jgi:hypothetical protein